jgi:hypothetical protein
MLHFKRVSFVPLLCVALIQTSAQKAKPAPTPVAAAPAAFSNDDVIALASAGMSDDIILAKIKSAPTKSFDTSVAGLKALKAGGVSAPVIRYMIDPSAPAAAAPAAAPVAASAAAPASTDANDPVVMHPPGIYMLATGRDGAIHLTKLEHVAPKQAKQKGALLSSMTYGITKAHNYAVLDGKTAAVQTTDVSPTFYAYIPEDSSAFGGSTITIKDFSLVQFKLSGDTREAVTGTASIWGTAAGTDEKSRQGFISDVVKPGIYKLTPLKPLPAGQYAFQQTGTQGTAQGQNTGAYFDFGIIPNQ